MMRSRYLLPSLAALVLMLVSALWLLTADFPYLDKKQVPSGGTLGQVDAGHELVQTFTAPADSISRMELVMSKSDYRSGGELRLRMYEFLGTEPDGAPRLGELIHEASLDLGSFDYVGGQRIELEPVPVRRGEMYALRITSDNPAAEGVSLIGSLTDFYEGGSFYKDGIPVDGDLYLLLYHTTDTEGLLTKIAPFRPAPLGSTAFFGIMFLFAAGTLGWLLWEVAASPGLVKDGRREPDAAVSARSETDHLRE